MKKFVKFLVIFLSLLIYIICALSAYSGLRKDIFVHRRTVITDERILAIIQRAEEIVKPGVEIQYYSLNTLPELHSHSRMNWQGFVNGYYKTTGVWPMHSFEKVFITDVALKKLTDKELLFIIGHELGHVRSDVHWRGKGFLLANKYLAYSVIYWISPEMMGEYYFQEEVRIESEADEAGIKCVGPETALRALRTLEMVEFFMGRENKVLSARISIIEKKYGLK